MPPPEDRAYFVAALSAELSGRVYLTAEAVCGFVAARFGPACTPHATAPLPGRLGHVWKRPKVLPSNHGRVNVTLDGALSWPAREVITREAKKTIAPEMAAFFARIEARYQAARRASAPRSASESWASV